MEVFAQGLLIEKSPPQTQVRRPGCAMAVTQARRFQLSGSVTKVNTPPDAERRCAAPGAAVAAPGDGVRLTFIMVVCGQDV